MNQIFGRKKKHTKGYGVQVIAALVLFAGLFGALVIVPAVSPAAGAQIADTIRLVAGPQPVAALESVSFRVQDLFNQFLSAHNGGQKQISLSQNNNIHPADKKLRQTTVIAGSVVISTPVKPVADSAAKPIRVQPVADAVTTLPQIGWQAYGPTVNGAPVMAQTLLSLDLQRPYAGIALVRIDLSKLKLHMEPGFLEPSHTKEIVNAIPHLGLMPVADQRNLVAGFNGGFKAVNGQYGMMVNGITLLQAIPGLAVVAIYRDGHIQIGAWGQDIIPSADIVAFRQNCPLLIQAGHLNPQVFLANRAIWGNTIDNKEITWRTGLSITQDGRYLIYAVGNGTTVQTLAQALQDAGAYNAMQLDINRHYAHFVTYKSSGKPNPPLRAVQLLDQMESDPTLYLVAHSRDYFYLTSK